MNKEAMEAKEKVRAVYLEAVFYRGVGGWDSVILNTNKRPWFPISGPNNCGDEDAAWIDAEARLPARVEEPVKPTATGEYSICAICGDRIVRLEYLWAHLGNSPQGKTYNHKAIPSAEEPAMPTVTEPVLCYICRSPVFLRENGAVVAHFDGNGDKCKANETIAPIPSAIDEARNWVRIKGEHRKDVIGVRSLPDGRLEYLMHNEALCRPYYVAVSASPASTPSASEEAGLPGTIELTIRSRFDYPDGIDASLAVERARIKRYERHLLEARKEIARLTERLDDAENVHQLSVAGVVRDISQASGWRNIRAEKAEDQCIVNSNAEALVLTKLKKAEAALEMFDDCFEQLGVRSLPEIVTQIDQHKAALAQRDEEFEKVLSKAYRFGDYDSTHREGWNDCLRHIESVLTQLQAAR